MSRRPIHLTAAGPRHDRQAQWEAMRRLAHELPDGFSAPDIRGALNGSANLATLRSYCHGLVAAGYLERDGQRYRLVRDCGLEAPRVRRDGSPVTQGVGREALWRAMRVLRSFSIAELAATASTEEHPVATSEARGYCGWLARAGYLVRDGERYRIIPACISGPRPPQIQRIKQVYDPNKNMVVYRQGEDQDHD